MNDFDTKPTRSIDHEIKLIQLYAYAILADLKKTDEANAKWAEEIYEAATRIYCAIGLNGRDSLMMELSGKLQEHPEGWEGECFCVECLNS